MILCRRLALLIENMNTTNINNTIEEPKSTLVFTPITESQSQDSYVYKSEV